MRKLRSGLLYSTPTFPDNIAAVLSLPVLEKSQRQV